LRIKIVYVYHSVFLVKNPSCLEWNILLCVWDLIGIVFELFSYFPSSLKLEIVKILCTLNHAGRWEFSQATQKPDLPFSSKAF
jgi:hypothetical protein